MSSARASRNRGSPGAATARSSQAAAPRASVTTPTPGGSNDGEAATARWDRASTNAERIQRSSSPRRGNAQHSKFNRLIVAGIAAAAIAPTAALASPAHRRCGAAGAGPRRRQVAGGAPGTGVMQDFRAPDQVDGSTVDRPVAGRDADVAHQPAADREAPSPPPARRWLTTTASTAASWSPSAAARCCSPAASASRAASACRSCASASRPRAAHPPGTPPSGGVPGTRRRTDRTLATGEFR